MNAHLSVSLVVPVCSGKGHLPALVARQEQLRAHLETSGLPVRHLESIFVCDEPIDGSADLLEELAASRPWMTVLHLGRKMGQHGATAAGLLHTSGDWVVTMDEGGEHDPLAVVELLKGTVPRSLDICYASPTGARHVSGWRNRLSEWAKRLVASLVGDPVVPLFNGFRLIRGEIARAASALSSHDLYLDVALRWLTNRVGTVALDLGDPGRGAQWSGYSGRSLLAHLGRLLMSYQLTVLRYVTVGGFVSATVFGLSGIANLLLKIVFPDIVAVRGWTSMFVMISFFGSLTVFLLGLILELLVTTLTRAQGRPAFFIADRSRDALWGAAKEVAEAQPVSA